LSVKSEIKELQSAVSQNEAKDYNKNLKSNVEGEIRKHVVAYKFFISNLSLKSDLITRRFKYAQQGKLPACPSRSRQLWAYHGKPCNSRAPICRKELVSYVSFESQGLAKRQFLDESVFPNSLEHYKGIISKKRCDRLDHHL
jgi:hypothetical protein